MFLDRIETESIKEYKIRLLFNKDEYGLSYKEIADLVNRESGDSKSETTYRKWWAGYKEGYFDAEKSNMKSEDIIDQYEEKRVEAEKARVRYLDQRTLYNKNIRNDARFDELKYLVTEAISSLKPYETKTYPISGNSGSLLVTLDDIHFGANISNQWNVYNPEVAKERLNRYLDNIIRIGTTHKADKCFVCANGDFISGNIHHTIQISNSENVVKQIMGVSELVSWFLSELSSIFKSVTFSVVSGNHSRLAKKDDSPKDERLDDLIPWYIKARLSNINNIVFVDNNMDNTFNIVNIEGLNYLNVHGDFDNFFNKNNVIDMIDIPIYCVHLGHKHRNKTEWVQKYKVITAGSLQGMDDYCIQKRLYGKAQQLVCVCNSNGILCTYDVDLQEGETNACK